MIAIAAIVVVVVLVAFGALRNGLAADRAPGRIETAIARRLVVLSIPRDQRALVNPLAADADAWRDGADHFGEHCAVCHGADGRGASELGPKMYPPVPDLASPAMQALSDGALFAVVQNGVRWTGMPAFRSEHSADETWRLVSFIRRMPHLTPRDLPRHDGSEAHDHAEAHDRGEAQDRPPAHDHGDAATHAALTIAMDGTAFSPSETTSRVGDTVTWINKDPFPHNISFANGGPRSGDVEPDARWRFRATTPGTFPYVCTLHPGMKGTLIITPSRREGDKDR